VTGEWMLASAVLAVLIYGAAVALQRVVALYGSVPMRWIWVVAMTCSAAVPASWLATPGTNSLSPVATQDRDVSSIVHRPDATSVSSADAGLVHRAAPRRLAFDLPRVPAGADRPLSFIWWVLSAVLVVVLLSAAFRLSRARRCWQSRSVAGQTVFVSPDLGPAVVGVLRPCIVLPAWVLHLDEHEQRLIVRHETEHLAARDPALLLATLGLLILIPWNLGLWMQWRALRRAIEIDCDARVLRHGVEATVYAETLLRASAYGHGGRLPSMAFAERVTSLSTRIEHLMRPAPRRRAMKTIAGVLAALLAVVLVSAMRAPKRRGATQASSFAADTVRFERRADPVTSRVEMTDRIFQQLFTDIRLDEESERRAREAIATEQDAQADLRGPVLAIWPKRVVIAEARNARLRALVSGNDLVKLDARLAERAYRQITSEDVARNTFASYLSGIALSPEDRAKAEHLIRWYVANDLEAFERPGYDVMSANLREVLEEDLRAYVRSPEDRARYDQRLAAMRAHRPAVRAVVHLTSVGLSGTKTVGDSLDAPLLVYGTGRVRVGVGGNEPVELTDTLRLYRLPAITADVTDGELHLELTGRGKLEVGGDVTGGPATHVTAAGRHVVLLKGGIGIRSLP
jgi:beta-lactamase regulating signal transducer with metallopeptidase domain